MSEPGGTPHDIETAAFKAHGLTRGHFRQEGRDHAKGARRPLRVKPTDLDLEGGVDQFGAHITVAFTLPAGSYATVLLRELMKKEVIDQVDSPVAPDVPQTSAPDADQ
jgi:tRNA pseudouridine13 synthase